MNEHTIKLLKECNSGCKMALDSIKQVCEYVDDDDLRSVMDTYTVKHEDLETRSGELLTSHGKCEKEPGIMASTFSWITAEMKLMIKDGNHQIAKLMMDGCNMGIQSVSRYCNEYSNADKEAQDLAQDLVKIEEDFMRDLKQFL